MSDNTGAPLGEPGYRLIDADAHINEPPDLWTSRLPGKLQDRAPRVQRFDQGDAWVLEGVKDPINFGSNTSAGVPLEQRSAWIRWEDVRPGGYDPKARLMEMDTDLVDACVLYPSSSATCWSNARPTASWRPAGAMRSMTNGCAICWPSSPG